MTKRKLRSFVIPTVYIISLSAIILSILLIGNTIKNIFSLSVDKYYVTGILIDNVIPTVKEVNQNTQIIKPYNNEKVAIAKSFYSKDSDEETQKKSLIYYQNTYMQNSGVLYNSDETFDVLSVLNGTVKNIENDTLLGTYIVIEHDADLSTIYYSITDTTLKVGDAVKQGDVIGKSGTNKITDSKKNNLLFEVNYKGSFIDPEKFYSMNIEDLLQ